MAHAISSWVAPGASDSGIPPAPGSSKMVSSGANPSSCYEATGATCDLTNRGESLGSVILRA
jgi:hypothetical protein